MLPESPKVGGKPIETIWGLRPIEMLERAIEEKYGLRVVKLHAEKSKNLHWAIRRNIHPDVAVGMPDTPAELERIVGPQKDSTLLIIGRSFDELWGDAKKDVLDYLTTIALQLGDDRPTLQLDGRLAYDTQREVIGALEEIYDPESSNPDIIFSNRT